MTIDGRGGCTLFRVFQEIKHWHARLVFGTHTHTHLATSCHILPHLALLFGLESSASGTALDCGCHPRGIGHQESGVCSLCYSLGMSQYISVLLCPIHLLSLSIHVQERTSCSCSILYFCQFHRTCPPRAMTSD